MKSEEPPNDANPQPLKRNGDGTVLHKPSEEDERVIHAVETELRRLSGELHKDLCQTLVGVGMQVHTMLRAATQNEAIPAERLTHLKETVEDAIDEARALLKNLNPREPEFGGLGLMTMLQEFAEERSRHIRCEFKCRNPVFIADDRVAHTLFRIAQECCRLDLKDLRLKTIRISLFHERNRINLEVRYEGENLHKQKCLQGSGLMHARARSVGAELKLQSGPTHTKILCTVPVPTSPLAKKA